MANHMVDLTKQRFGRLTVIAPIGKNKSGNYLWDCVCDCGAHTVVASGCLRSGTTVSCGCYIREVTSKRSNAVFTINGEAKTVTQWARKYGVKPITVFSRLYKGMDIVEALTKSTERRTAQ